MIEQHDAQGGCFFCTVGAVRTVGAETVEGGLFYGDYKGFPAASRAMRLRDASDYVLHQRGGLKRIRGLLGGEKTYLLGDIARGGPLLRLG